ncbi:MAG: Tryptophan-tRNA ligase [Candidatus Azambacteria bacterium GW2011_GWA1_44_9]|uniref:Tryptophan--tRNA ligase n=3 Tax=Parcubacteria group TaxID=1794811 RepID=A0A0G1NDA2_9BACT|nr:MAG: Tryptophan-tRNA ligase [Candidatus Azambacteria bacterium GW2011_GWA1_44_9]
MKNPILISGIQPTGRLHLGNYLGALKNFVDLQNSGKYQCRFFVADLHALTENPNAKDLNKNIVSLAADFLAAGLDPKKSTIFLQSQVSQTTELAWILSVIAPFGELNRMTQFKEKSGAQKENVNVGLFFYPILMSADIILYNADFVPVGEDQLQHLELARTLARKFNNKFGQAFIEPKALLTATPRLMSLDDPSKKMSKSRPAGCLFIDDSPEEIEKKIKTAVTDSGSEIKYDEKEKPGISNLLSIMAGLSGKPIATLEKEFANANYGKFKQSLAVLVSDYFASFRKKKAALLKKPATLKKVLQHGSVQAQKIAVKKLAEIKEKIGLVI